MVRHLHESGHEVHVASLVRSEEEEQQIQGVRDYCTEFVYARVGKMMQALKMVGCLLTTIPSSMGFFHSAKLKRQVNRLLQQHKYDLIVVFSSSAAQYVEHVDDVPKFLDFCDMDSQKWLAYADFKRWPISMGYWLEGTKLQRAEKQLAKRFDLCSCATDFEVDTLEQYQTGVKSGFFPNGVDSEFFQPNDGSFTKHNISFVGRMDYYPNEEAVISFAERVFPIIRQKYPDAQFTIIGAEPPVSVRDLAKIDGVTVTGTVDDIRTYVLDSEVMIASLKIARGTQNKILEGMAMGVPVISSANAARGVDAVTEEHLLAATTDQEYADQVMSIFEDPEKRKRLSLAGRERVTTHHNWIRAMSLFDQLINQTIEHKQAQDQKEAC